MSDRVSIGLGRVQTFERRRQSLSCLFMANNKKDDNYDDECQILYGIKKMKNKQIDLCVARLKDKLG